MGVNVGVNAITSGGLGLATVLLVVTGILLVTAQKKVGELPEFESSSVLRKASGDLRTAYILLFIAAGITLILGIAYAGHEVAWCPSEWIHGFIYLLLVAALIIGVIYAYIALNDIYSPDLDNDNGASAFVWASLIVGTITFMVVIATASGRVGYNAARNDVQHRVRHAEAKIHETHSHVTGKQNDFVPPVDRCGEAEEPCGKPAVPPGMMLVPTTQVQSVGVDGPVRLPAVPQPVQQFIGAPTVTRHSVVTTSQPSVVTSSPAPLGIGQLGQREFI